MPGEIATIMISVLVVMLGVYWVSKYPSWFKKNRLKLISLFMILGIMIYTIGYLKKNPTDYLSSGLMAIFSTGRMFVFENDISSFENDVAGIPYYSLVFGLIMTLSMLTTGMIVLSFLGYRVMCRIQLMFVKLLAHNKRFYIFAGLNEKALYLAADLKKHNRKAYIIFCISDFEEDEVDQNLVKTVTECGYILVGDYNNKEIFHLCKSLRNNKLILFAINENDNENAGFVNDFSEKMKLSGKTIPVSIYTFVKINESEDLFSRNISNGLDIQVIDEDDLYSRQLFHKFTLISCLGKSDTLTVCVIGHSEISENLYRNITYLGQCYGVKLKLVMIDEDIEDKAALFFNKNPEIHKCAEYVCINLKPNTRQFFEYFHKEMININCVVVANENIDTATEISRISSWKEHAVKLCVLVKDYRKYNLLFKTRLLKDAVIFGSDEEIFTESIIINETLDMLAKSVHAYYCKLYGDTRSWNEISLFEKQSNRALALHIQSKLNSVGLRYKNGGDTLLFDELIKDKEVLERLAIGEHLRWNAYSHANGWITMENIQNQVKNKDTVLKKHSCLVDWDELDTVSKKFEKDYKEMDRHLVRNIGNILQTVDCGIEQL